jgi:hypothetical protein
MDTVFSVVWVLFILGLMAFATWLIVTDRI